MKDEAGTGVAPSPRLDFEIEVGLEDSGEIWGVDGIDRDWSCGCTGGAIGLAIAGGWNGSETTGKQTGV